MRSDRIAAVGTQPPRATPLRAVNGRRRQPLHNSRGRGRLCGGSLYRISRDRFLVPTNPGSCRRWGDYMAVADDQRLGDNGIRPVDVLEPMPGRRHGEQMGAYLGEEV